MGKTFDCVVMLTSSDWFTELRSNRYHYAIRFARHYPVLFVQPDKKGAGYTIESTSVPNLCVAHVSTQFNIKQAKALDKLLQERGVFRPIFWIYNVNFAGYLYRRIHEFSTHQLLVFHATEDYFSKDSPIRFKKGMGLYSRLRACLKMTNLLVSVSSGVEQSYLTEGQYKGRSIVITNGCDDLFYTQGKTRERARRVAFYQGNIFAKLDYRLLIHLAENLSDWTFVFCGPVLFNEGEWQKLLTYKNVSYLGVLTPEEVRQQAYDATVGLIPFKQASWLVEKSFPLKAFEYLACGLPVVSVTINALKPFSDVFAFADTMDAFQRAMIDAEKCRWNDEAILKRQSIAKRHSYDRKFDLVHAIITKTEITHKPPDFKWQLFLRWILLTAPLRNAIKKLYKGFLCVRHSRYFYISGSKKTI